MAAPDLRKATAIGLLLFVCFNLNLRAISSRDSRIITLTAASLGLWRTSVLDRFPAVRGEDGVAVVNGHLVPLYPIVPAVVAAPAFGLAAGVGILDRTKPSEQAMEAIGKVTASAITAVACAFLYLLVRRSTPVAPAALVVIAAALGTPYWSTASQALWGHATAACTLAIALWFGTRMDTSRRAALIAGAAVAAAASTRPLLLPFVAGLIIHQRRSAHRVWLVAATISLFACVIIWNLSVVERVLGGTSLLESPEVHRQTHLVDSAWNPNLFTGAVGMLFSPSRGLLVFMPIVGWTIAGAARLWRRSLEARLTIVLPTAGYLIGWSAYSVWWGGHSYGPRYATDLVVPFTIMAAATLFGGPSPARRWSRRAAGVALAWSIAVQGIGVFCYPGGAWNDAPVDVDRAHARLWDWSDSEIMRTAAAGPYTKQLPRLSGLIHPHRALEPARRSDSNR